MLRARIRAGHFGAPIHAAANGVVVSVVNDRPEMPPFATTGMNPTIRGPRDFAGNNVVERIAPGKYAIYLHVQTGSVRVKVRQRVRTGRASRGDSHTASITIQS
jgi:murein DD-endopeptidase MepM/ murein hydrolase activator NlpD